MFEGMKLRIVESTVENLFRIKAAAKDQGAEIERKQKRQLENLNFAGSGDAAKPAGPVHAAAKVGRNDPCPCGSGIKYKKCHGK
jgi:preprotein translocase subunit SecA